MHMIKKIFVILCIGVYNVLCSGISEQLIAHHAGRKIPAATPKPLGFGIKLWGNN